MKVFTIGYGGRTKEEFLALLNWLAKEGIGYRSFIELGNDFIEDPQDWARRYEALLRTSGDILTERLRAAPGPVCLLCAERHVVDCHRFLVARYLADRHGAEIEHLE